MAVGDYDRLVAKHRMEEEKEEKERQRLALCRGPRTDHWYGKTAEEREAETVQRARDYYQREIRQHAGRRNRRLAVAGVFAVLSVGAGQLFMGLPVWLIFAALQHVHVVSARAALAEYTLPPVRLLTDGT